MKWFYDLKISAKLIINFVVVAILAGMVGIVGITGIVNIYKMEQSDQVNIDTVVDIASITKNYQKERVYLYELYLTEDANKRSQIINNLTTCDEIINKSMANFDLNFQDATVKQKLNELSQLINEFFDIHNQIITLAQADKMNEMDVLINNPRMQEIDTEIQGIINDLIAAKNRITEEKVENFTHTVTYTVLGIVITIVLSIVIAVILGIGISCVISNPIKELVHAAEQLSEGDVNIDLKVRNTKDEIGTLTRSFGMIAENIREQAIAAEKLANGDMTTVVKVHSEKDLLGKQLVGMVKKNREMLIHINTSAEKVAVGSKQISDLSVVLSTGATQQASVIEELTSSLDDLSSKTTINAKKADEANKLATQAKTNALQGNNEMKEMLRSVKEINEASANISQIIKLIDDIAFQTNILALNAAVEAARAGRHGKGFAVVAEEVRSLAEKSADAAKETARMIEGSIKKSEDGMRIAKHTAKALDEIVNDIGQVANLISDIADASNEQAMGIGQINQAVMQVSEVTKNTSDTSREGIAAGEQLLGEANLLKKLVGQFKLQDNIKSYHEEDEIQSEVFKILDKMSEEKQVISTGAEEKFDQEIWQKDEISEVIHKVNEIPREDMAKEVNLDSMISLSDQEFGKY